MYNKKLETKVEKLLEETKLINTTRATEIYVKQLEYEDNILYVKACKYAVGITAAGILGRVTLNIPETRYLFTSLALGFGTLAAIPALKWVKNGFTHPDYESVRKCIQKKILSNIYGSN